MFKLDERKIRNLMFTLQLSGRALAKKAGLTPKTLGNLIRGKAKANARSVGKLAQALGVNGEEIIILEGGD